MKPRIIAVTLVAVLVALIGYSKTPESEIVGVWREGKSSGSVFSFRTDGSCVITPLEGGRDVYGTWAISGAKLTITERAGGRKISLDMISLGKDEFNFRPGAGQKVVTLARVSDTPFPPSQSELAAATPEGRRAIHEQETVMTARSVDKAVLNNARQLAAASDQYFLENGVSKVALKDLIGPTAYIKALNTVASETYPNIYTQGVTITITGIAGARTITYAP